MKWTLRIWKEVVERDRMKTMKGENVMDMGVSGRGIIHNMSAFACGDWGSRVSNKIRATLTCSKLLCYMKPPTAGILCKWISISYVIL
jgi:hypothetical protein